MGAIASHLWQSTLVAAVAAALAWLLRQNRASVRYWIWFAASMKFLVPFAALSAVARALPRSDWAVPDNEAVAAMTVVFRLADLEVGGAAEFAWWPIWAVSLAGTCLVLARWSWEWNRVSAIARAAEPIIDGPVHDALRRLESANGIQSPTTIVSSQQNLEPGVVGIRTPVLLWPRHLADGMHRDHIESIVAHELSHVMRRDNLLALVHMMVSAAFWFHPVVWWIGTRLVEERERACDEQVLALGQSPASYAAGILKTCELCVASSLANVPGIGGGDLKKRITRIMRNDTIAPLGRAKKVALGRCRVGDVPRAFRGRHFLGINAILSRQSSQCRTEGRGPAGSTGGRCQAATTEERSEAAILGTRQTRKDRGRGSDGVRGQGRWNGRGHHDYQIARS